MAYLDRAARRLDLKLVYWGPGRGGKTTSLRSLHGAFAAADRGEIQSVETADERTYFFDYAPLDLPRFRDHQIRVHAFTVPGQDMYAETRKRILRGADGVIFVADATPSVAAANQSAWRQLDEALALLWGRTKPPPVLVAVNKIELEGAVRAPAMMASLAAVVARRVPIDVVETTAIAGRGVMRCFRTMLTAAAEHALACESTDVSGPEWRAREEFLVALSDRVHGSDDAAAVVPTASSRAVVVHASEAAFDAAGLEVALEASRRLAQRDRDVRELHRQQAYGRLLLDVGRECLRATSGATLASTVLASLAWNLEASVGWIGLPDATGGAQVFDAQGPTRGGDAVDHFARRVGVGIDAGATVAVEIPADTELPGDAAGRRGVFAPFSTGDGRKGWILLLGSRDRGLSGGAEDVLAPAGACVGLTLARLDALVWLQDSNAILERRVAERTQDLRNERDSLERRVRERTAELEAAKHATLEAERRLIDLERNEGVQRLAAGLAHEINNPLGAASANLDFVRETIEALADGLDASARADADDALSALADAHGEIRKVSSNVTSLFAGATSSRRAAIKSPVASSVRDAVLAHARTRAGAPPPTIVEKDAVYCGVPPAECSRWLFRLLGVLGRDRRSTIHVEIDRSDDGPRVSLSCEEASGPVITPEFDALALEIERAGGALRMHTSGGRPVARVVLPRAVGDTKPPVAEAAR